MLSRSLAEVAPLNYYFPSGDPHFHISILTSFRLHDSCVFSLRTIWWRLARHGHDLCAGGCPAEVIQLHVFSVFAPSVTCTVACLIALLSVTCCSIGASQHMPRRMASRAGRLTFRFSSQLTTPIHRIVRAHGRFVGRVCARQSVRAEFLAEFGVIGDVAWN